MNRPAPVEITYENMRFLITHNPTNTTLNRFIEVRQPEKASCHAHASVEALDSHFSHLWLNTLAVYYMLPET